MEPNKTSLERAFELARSGRYRQLFHIVETLRRERYDISQIEGPRLKAQLKAIITEHRPDLH